MELLGKKINFLGDSITEANGVNKSFWTVLGENCGTTVRGYGIGGTRIAKQHVPSIYPQHDLDFPSRVGDMDPDADIIVVFGGTNDFGHGDAPLGTPADRTKDTFYGACHELYTSLIEKYPTAVIAIMTPLHRTEEYTIEGKCLLTYVNIIREVAEYYSLPVLDLYATSGIQPQIPVHQETYMPDGLHPNDEGHKVIARKLEAFLRSL